MWKQDRRKESFFFLLLFTSPSLLITSLLFPVNCDVCLSEPGLYCLRLAWSNPAFNHNRHQFPAFFSLQIQSGKNSFPPPPTPIIVGVWVISRSWSTFYPCLQPSLQPRPSPIPCILPFQIQSLNIITPLPLPTHTRIRVRVWVFCCWAHYFIHAFNQTFNQNSHQSPALFSFQIQSLNMTPPPPTPIGVQVQYELCFDFGAHFYPCLNPSL